MAGNRRPKLDNLSQHEEKCTCRHRYQTNTCACEGNRARAGGTWPGITSRMYEQLFQDEAIRDLFNQSHHGETGSQPKALANAVLAYARNIDHLTCWQRGRAHRAEACGAEYPRRALSLRGTGCWAQSRTSWAISPPMRSWQPGEKHTGFLRSSDRTGGNDLSSSTARPADGSAGATSLWKASLTSASIIRSFTLVPADGGTILRHKPGQYLGFALELPNIGMLRRNYSISCAPNDRAYRITVKREVTAGVPPGQASNWLHDRALPGTVLRVAAPAGDFFLDSG